ncbi:MAG: hypothetical protein ABIW49_09110 [Knoellia sp.]
MAEALRPAPIDGKECQVHAQTQTVEFSKQGEPMAGQSAKAHAPKRLRPTKVQSDHASETEASEAEARYRRLMDARASTSALLEVRLSDERGVEWAAYLRDTAGHVVDVLSELALDMDFWSDLLAGEQSLGMASPEKCAAVSEILESDLTGLLDLMGYAPPPPSDEIGREMQIAFSEAIEVQDAARRGQVSREAAHQMLVYVYRLRKLIADVDNATSGTSHPGRLGQRLSAMARTGARVIIPATITAGVVAGLFPGAAAATAAGALTVGLTAAGKEATKQGLQLASAGMIAGVLGQQDAKVNPEVAFNATGFTFFRAALDARAMAGYLLEEQPEELAPVIQASVIEAMRWSFQLERARSALAESARVDPAQLAAKAVTGALTELRDWIQFAPDYEGLEDIHLRLAVALEQLEKYLSSIV